MASGDPRHHMSTQAEHVKLNNPELTFVACGVVSQLNQQPPPI